MKKSISHPFVLTQDYRSAAEQPVPDDFPIFSESFSVAKVNIDSAKEIVLRNPLIQSYLFRSKKNLENPVSIALFVGNDREKNINHFYGTKSLSGIHAGIGSPLLSDPGIGRYMDLLEGQYPQVSALDTNAFLPFRVAFKEIYEYGDDPGDYQNPGETENYRHASALRILTGAQISGVFLIAGATFSSPQEIEVANSHQYEYLYIVPYLPKVQRTQVALSGRINFELEY